MLMNTGRCADALLVREGLDKEKDNLITQCKQVQLPISAEYSIVPPIKLYKQPIDYQNYIDDLEIIRSVASSLFLRRLTEMEIEWFKKKGGEKTSDPDRWLSFCRDGVEKVTALHRLVVHLSRQGNYKKAEEIAALAVNTNPFPEFCWTWVSVSNGNLEVIKKARNLSPEHPDIFLAYLVVRFGKEGYGSWIESMLKTVLENHTYSIETIVRAGDYLLRNGCLKEAILVAKYTIKYGAGYLPAYVHGINCAYAKRDYPWAIVCTMKAISYADDPLPFYKRQADLKMEIQLLDSDLLEALQRFVGENPESIKYLRALGLANFKLENFAASLLAFQGAIKAGDNNVATQLFAADAARLAGKEKLAVATLMKVTKNPPEKINVYSSLVHSLAQIEKTIPIAEKLLPRLLENKDFSMDVRHTISFVYLQTGKYQEAQDNFDQLLKEVNEEDSLWLEANLNFADLKLRQGKYLPAKKILDVIRDDARLKLVDFALVSKKIRSFDKQIDDILHGF